MERAASGAALHLFDRGDVTERLVHEVGEGDVLVRHAAGIVRREGDVDAVVDVEPFGVVVVAFGVERDAAHEAEGGVEVLEAEFLLDGVAARDGAPAAEAGEGGFRADLCGGHVLCAPLIRYVCGGVRGTSGPIYPGIHASVCRLERGAPPRINAKLSSTCAQCRPEARAPVL